MRTFCFAFALLFALADRMAAAPRPNVVIFLADDMGYSDLGCYGGEVETPNLDALAKDGLRFTQFYNTARCSPSRASLMTGLYNWQTGIGHLIEDWLSPGYTPSLNRNCVTIAEVLKSAGYGTYMAGKWHIGGREMNQLPCQRGFDRWFGTLGDRNSPLPDYGGSYYGTNFWLNNTFQDFPPGRYNSDRFTDYALQFLEEHLIRTNSPFFLYGAFRAPHVPLTAPPEGIEKYRQIFTKGWEVYRRQRFARQKAMGIVDANETLSPAEHGLLWKNLTDEEKEIQHIAMATHAAMVENIDTNIGRVVDFLKSNGLFANTAILFLSDNGASAEGGSTGLSTRTRLSAVGANWSNTPFRLYKKHTHEGGISTPLIVHYPPGITNAGLRFQPGHLIDIMPTVLELTGSTYPTNFHGNPITPLEGRSLVRFFNDTSVHPRILFFEHEGNRAIRSNDWKLVANGRTGPWELYDLAQDRSETNNVAALHPDVATSLANAWEAMAWRVGAYPSPDVNKSLKMRVWPSVQDSATGNGDGYPQAGETVELTLLTIKHGTGPDTGLTGTLGSTDPRVVILNEAAVYNDFASGKAANLTPFRVRIASNMPVNDTILFELRLSSGGIVQWCESFALQVRSCIKVSDRAIGTGRNEKRNASRD